MRIRAFALTFVASLALVGSASAAMVFQTPQIERNDVGASADVIDPARCLDKDSGPVELLQRKAQRRLIALGYYHGEVDGFMGPNTRAAIMKFQRDSRLKESGLLNKPTLRALGLEPLD